MAKRKTRVSKADRITAAVMQAAAHESTMDLNNRRDVLVFESAVVEQEIAALSVKLANARGRLASIEAMLLGIGLTIGKR